MIALASSCSGSSDLPFSVIPNTDIETLKKKDLYHQYRIDLKFISVILTDLVFSLNSLKPLTQQSLIWKTVIVNPTT